MEWRCKGAVRGSGESEVGMNDEIVKWEKNYSEV
jgi:hypothetical protein